MAKYEVTYPRQIPAAAVKDVLRIVKGGPDSIVAQRSDLGLAWYQVQGYAQAVCLGDPDDVNVIGGGAEGPVSELTHGEFLTALESMSVAGDASLVSQVDWRAIIKFFLTNILPLIIAK